MIRTLTFVLAVAVTLSACGPLPSVESPRPTHTAPSPLAATSTPLLVVSPTRVVITSSSLSLFVENPPEALARLEALVEEAGGFVSSASSWDDGSGGYASLSAKVPPAALPDLRRAAIALATGVQSNSTYSQDVTSEQQSLRERLALIDESEGRLLQALLGTNDPSLAKSFVLVAELLQQERRNAESQLHSYEDSSTLSSFDVSLNRPSTVLRLLEEATPFPYAE